MDLGRLDRREPVEQLVGERRGAVLDGARQAVLAGDHAELAQDLEVELDLGDATARERDAAVRGPGLDADLGDARGARGQAVELAPIAVEIGAQLGHGRVLGPDLADLATDADRDAVGLERPDERRQLGRAQVVLALLLVDGRLREVDQRRGVDVDVAIAGVDREPAGAPDLLGHRLGVGGVLLGVELVVVALDEDRPLPARGDRPGQDRGRVVDRALERVGLLAPGQFEDDRADIGRGRRLVDRPGHVEGLGAQVDRRHGEARDLATRAPRRGAGCSPSARRAPGSPPRRAIAPSRSSPRRR